MSGGGEGVVWVTPSPGPPFSTVDMKDVGGEGDTAATAAGRGGSVSIVVVGCTGVGVRVPAHRLSPPLPPVAVDGASGAGHQERGGEEWRRARMVVGVEVMGRAGVVRERTAPRPVAKHEEEEEKGWRTGAGCDNGAMALEMEASWEEGGGRSTLEEEEEEGD